MYFSEIIGEETKSMSVTKALALLLDRGLSKIDYLEISDAVNSANEHVDIMPPYYRLEKEKLNLRPDGVVAEDHDVKCPFPAVIKKTVLRILEDKDVAHAVLELCKKNGGKLKLVFYLKYGMDGSSGHPIFKQAYADREPGSLMASHMVALQLVTEVGNQMYIVYDNALSNSPYACRPLRYWFVKETKQRIQLEIDRLKQELEEFEAIWWTDDIEIDIQAYMSMVDGKTVNVWHNNPCSGNCPYCFAKRSQMNVKKVFKVSPELLRHCCLSQLHFGLNSVNNLFNVGFYQPIQQACVSSNMLDIFQ